MQHHNNPSWIYNVAKDVPINASWVTVASPCLRNLILALQSDVVAGFCTFCDNTIGHCETVMFIEELLFSVGFFFLYLTVFQTILSNSAPPPHVGSIIQCP